eukprot:7183517-Prorocentrum_lima.AAC.1
MCPSAEPRRGCDDTNLPDLLVKRFLETPHTSHLAIQRGNTSHTLPHPPCIVHAWSHDSQCARLGPRRTLVRA